MSKIFTVKAGVPDKDGKYGVIMRHSGVTFKSVCEFKNGKWRLGKYGPEAPQYEILSWDSDTYQPLDISKVFTVKADEANKASTIVQNREEKEMEKYLERADWAVRNAVNSGVFKVSPPFYWEHSERYVWKMMNIIAKNGFAVKRNGDVGLTIIWK